MTKPSKPQEPTTEIIASPDGSGAPADMDKMMTTIRSVIAGRLMIIEGPGQPKALNFHQGSNSIGRDPARNVIALDFGDPAIHREHHAYLTCDNGRCTISDNGKQNPVKLNDRPISGATNLATGDIITIGTTKLRVEIA